MHLLKRCTSILQNIPSEVMIEISTKLTEHTVNGRNSTKLALTKPYATDREGRGKLFIISADVNRGTFHDIYFTASLEINNIKSHSLCNFSDKPINATAGTVPL